MPGTGSIPLAPLAGSRSLTAERGCDCQMVPLGSDAHATQRELSWEAVDEHRAGH